MTKTAAIKDRLLSDVSAQRVARVYAESLLRAAAGEAIVKELEDLVEMFRQAPQLKAFFSNPTIPAGVKTEALRKSLAARASPMLGNFLMVVNRHGRFDLLPTIAREARNLADRQANPIKGQVTSAAPPSKEDVERPTPPVRDLIHMEPQLTLSVDPELLGGFVFRAGDWKYDGSTRTQLRRIREQIIARSSHEIQSGRDRFRTGD